MTHGLNFFSKLERAFQDFEKAFNPLEEWNPKEEGAHSISPLALKVINVLVNVPGMTMAHSRDFKRATPSFTLKDGTIVKIFINPVRVTHIFLADSNNRMIFGGYVGWIHNDSFIEAINYIQKEFSIDKSPSETKTSSNRKSKTTTKPKAEEQLDGHTNSNKLGCIYLLEDTSKYIYKVGFSTNVKKRFKAHKTSNPFLKLVMTIPDVTLTDEKNLHKKLEQYRIPNTTEWYQRNSNIISIIIDVFPRI